MKKFFKGTALLAPLSAALAFMPSAKAVSIVDLAAIFSNPGFELSTGPCPTGWTCGGNQPNAFTVTTNEFTPGADGLGGLKLTPGGINAVVMPPIEGASALYKSFPAFQADTDYNFTLWIGTPKNVPVTPGGAPAPGLTAGPVQTARLYFLGNGGEIKFINLPIPAVGQWISVPISITAAQILAANAVGKSAQVLLFVESGANNQVITFDLVADDITPEPSSMALIGLGLAGLEVVRRRRNKA